MANQAVNSAYKYINRQLSGDPCMLPTAQTVIRNITAPITDDDTKFWLGMGPRELRQDVDLFVDPKASTMDPDDPRDESGTVVSSGLVEVGIRTKVPMIVDSLCIVMRGELDFAELDGNIFGDMTHYLAALTAGVDLPSLQSRFQNFLEMGAYAGTVSRYAAQLDINACCLRAARYFMEAFQVAIGCPTSPNVHEIVRQRLIEIGNCCFGPRPDGLGTSQRGWLEDVRRANERMHLMAQRGLFPTAATAARINMELSGIANQDLNDPLYGFFRSWNASTTISNTNASHIESIHQYQTKSVDEAHAALTVPGAQKWLRFRKPFVLDKDDNIDIKLSVDPQEEIFRQLALQQLSYQTPISEVKLNNAPLSAAQLAAVLSLQDGAYTANQSLLMARLPIGTLRFGILLKGVMLDCNVCSDIKQLYQRMTLDDFDKTPAGQARLSGLQRIISAGGDMGAGVIEPSGGCGCGG
jgi:hypothetical protein